MSAKRIASNTTIYYFIAVVVIVVAFLLLGGGPWLKGMMHSGSPRGMVSINWIQVLIGFGLGFLIGLLVAKRKW